MQVFLFVVLASVSVVTGHAQNFHSEIRGTLVSTDSLLPIEDVEIRICSKDSAILFTMRSGEQGSFHGLVQEGEHLLLAVHHKGQTKWIDPEQKPTSGSTTNLGLIQIHDPSAAKMLSKSEAYTHHCGGHTYAKFSVISSLSNETPLTGWEVRAFLEGR